MNFIRFCRINNSLTNLFKVQRYSTIVAKVLTPSVPAISENYVRKSIDHKNAHRNFSKMPESDFVAANLMDLVAFESVCSNTLESLCEYFEEIVELEPKFKNPDIIFSDGVLTVKLGGNFGTYVINRQTPNRQIWLSSPTSGPKRYDFHPIKNKINEGYWVYKHDGVTLHELLQKELSSVFSIKIDFLKLQQS